MEDHKLKISESEKKNKSLDFAREQKKLLNMRIKLMVGAQESGERTRGIENQKEDRNHPNYSIAEIRYNHIYQPLRSGRIWHKVNF